MATVSVRYLVDRSDPINPQKRLVLPKLHSIRNQCLMDSGGVTSHVQLDLGLIKGLAYLHEHKLHIEMSSRTTLSVTIICACESSISTQPWKSRMNTRRSTDIATPKAEQRLKLEGKTGRR